MTGPTGCVGDDEKPPMLIIRCDNSGGGSEGEQGSMDTGTSLEERMRFKTVEQILCGAASCILKAVCSKDALATAIQWECRRRFNLGPADLEKGAAPPEAVLSVSTRRKLAEMTTYLPADAPEGSHEEALRAMVVRLLSGEETETDSSE